MHALTGYCFGIETACKFALNFNWMRGTKKCVLQDGQGYGSFAPTKFVFKIVFCIFFVQIYVSLQAKQPNVIEQQSTE